MIDIDILRRKRGTQTAGNGTAAGGVTSGSMADYASEAGHAKSADRTDRAATADEAGHAQSAMELDGNSSVWGKIKSWLSDLGGLYLRKDADDETTHKLTVAEAEVKGKATVGGDAEVKGGATVGGSADVTGDAKVGGMAHVVGNGIVEGAAIVGGGATVTGNTALGGDLLLSGKANVYGVGNLKKGATFGDGTYLVDEKGVAKLAGAVAEYLKSRDYSKGTAQGFDGTGYGVTKDGLGKYTLEIDKIVARMKLIVAELEVHRMSFIGGSVVLSACGNRMDIVEAYDGGGNLLAAANGTSGRNVTYTDNGVVDNSKNGGNGGKLVIAKGKTVAKFRCYFLATDGEQAVKNEWTVGQLARCQTNNIAAPGTYKDYENRDYWRIVTNVSTNPVEKEGKKYFFIDLSNAPKGTAQKGTALTLTDSSGTQHVVEIGGVSETLNSMPQTGDNVVGMGHQWDTGRMDVAWITASGWTMYKGIDHYDLPYKNIVNKFGIDETIVTTDHFTMRPYADPDGDAVALCDRGGYSDDKYYGRGDLVTWDGQVWKCSVKRGNSVKGERPAAGSSSWTLYVMKGATLAVMYMALGDVLADEGQSFTLTAQTLVAFGAGDKWVFQTIKAGNYVANLTLFHNMDPVANVRKQAVKVTWSESAIEDAMWRAEKIGGTPGVVTSNTDWTIRRLERAQGTWVRYSDGTGFSGMEGESDGNSAAADSWYKRAISGQNLSAPDKMWSSGSDAWSAIQQDGVTVTLNVRRTPNGYRGVQFRIGGGNASTKETVMEYNGFGKVSARRMYLLHVFANHSTPTGSNNVAFLLDFYRPNGEKAGTLQLGSDTMVNGGYGKHTGGEFWFVFDPLEVMDAAAMQVRLVVKVTASVNTTICPAGLWDVTEIGNPMGTVKTTLMGVATGTWGAAPVTYGEYEWQEVKGDKGDDAITAILDHEMDSVACDSDGKVAADTTVTVTGRIYKGGSLLTSGVTGPVSGGVGCDIGGVKIVVSSSNGVITMQWPLKKGTALDARTVVRLPLNYGGRGYNTVFTLNGVRNGAEGPAAVSYRLVRMDDTAATVKVTGTGKDAVFKLHYVLHYKAMKAIGGVESEAGMTSMSATIEGKKKQLVATLVGQPAKEFSSEGDGEKSYTAEDRPQGTIPVEVNVSGGQTLYDTVPVTMEAGVAIDINQEIGEMKVMATGQISLAVGALEDGLEATGVNIKEKKITLISDKVVVRNNKGAETAMIDENGMLRTEMINTGELEVRQLTTVQPDETHGYTEMHDSTTIWYRSDGTPGISIWYDETGTPHLQFYMKMEDDDGNVEYKVSYDLGPSGLSMLLKNVVPAHTEAVTLWTAGSTDGSRETVTVGSDNVKVPVTIEDPANAGDGSTYYKFYAMVAAAGVTVADKEYDGCVMKANVTELSGLKSEDGRLWYNVNTLMVDGWMGMTKPVEDDPNSPGYDAANVLRYQELGYYVEGRMMRRVGLRINVTKGMVDKVWVIS